MRTIKITRNCLVHGEHVEAGTEVEVGHIDEANLIVSGRGVVVPAPEPETREAGSPLPKPAGAKSSKAEKQ